MFVEFLGGPRDGQCLEILDDYIDEPEPIAIPFMKFVMDPSPKIALQGMKTGWALYRFANKWSSVEPLKMYYQGDE